MKTTSIQFIFFIFLFLFYSCSREESTADKVEEYFLNTFVPANHDRSNVKIISFSQGDTIFFPNAQLNELNDIIWDYSQKHFNVLSEKVELINSLSKVIDSQEAIQLASTHYEKDITHINFVLSQTYFKVDSLNRVSPKEVALITFKYIYTVDLDTLTLEIGYSPTKENFSHMFL